MADAAYPPDYLKNFNAAHAELNFTPQESALYQMHLRNLWGNGGVDNDDGSRSTLYQSVQPYNGRYYNVPTVWNGKILTEQYTRPSDGKVFDVPNSQALYNIEQHGWDKFPSYATPDEAEQRYDAMHKFMEKDTADYMAARSAPAF